MSQEMTAPKSATAKGSKSKAKGAAIAIAAVLTPAEVMGATPQGSQVSQVSQVVNYDALTSALKGAYATAAKVAEMNVSITGSLRMLLDAAHIVNAAKAREASISDAAILVFGDAAKAEAAIGSAEWEGIRSAKGITSSWRKLWMDAKHGKYGKPEKVEAVKTVQELKGELEALVARMVRAGASERLITSAVAVALESTEA